MKRTSVALVVAAGALASAALAAPTASPVYNHVYATAVKGKGAQLDGTWVISFAPNGAYAVVKDPNLKVLLIGGSSTATRTTVTITDKVGPLRCTGTTARATYRWSLRGKVLRLTPVSERCAPRRAVLSTAPFLRVK